ncbi:MAG: DUF3108 domain-containing protein [Burkholderiaceae bacterium]
MARRLSHRHPAAPAPHPAPRGRHDRRALAIVAALVLLAHLLALSWLRGLLQPPSLLAQVVAPLYTRTITVQAPAAPPAPAEPIAQKSVPNRPTALIHRAPAAIKNKASKSPTQPASAPRPAAAPEPEPVPPAPDESADTSAFDAPPATPTQAEAEAETEAASTASPAQASASAPAPADATASAAEPAFLAHWPADTRLAYTLGGNYRGELHGSAQVLWQHTGTRYQAAVQLDVGILLSMRFTSQGEITAQGLAPEVYEEQVRQRRRGVRIGDTVRLDNGQTVPRPEGVQDTASQFVELAHRFATGQIAPAPGASIRLWLARPGGVDEWTYDVVGEDTLHLPRLGAVAALHLKPRRIDKPRGPISAEIWFAPTLQYLPVRIRLTQGPDTYMDLMVETIEQQ